MDYIGYGPTSRWYRQVPKTPDLEIISIFQDELRDIIPEKIQELLSRMEELEDTREAKLEALRKCKRKGMVDEFSEYFWVLLIETDFSEFDVAQKYLRYWLDILGHIAPEQVVYHNEMKESGFSEQEIERAKDYPIENLYKNTLRVRGTQLVGKCPFHEEKTPSFVIFTNDNHFHCFGCQAHGDAIEFAMKIKNLDFVEAVKTLL